MSIDTSILSSPTYQHRLGSGVKIILLKRIVKKVKIQNNPKISLIHIGLQNRPVGETPRFGV